MEQAPPILHLDPLFLVVIKPPWLLSVPGRGPDKQDSVVTRLARDFPAIREVHRLDWETSGLMLLARDKASHRALSLQFQQRSVEKEYIAQVAGQIAEAAGQIELPLICDWPNRPRQRVDHQLGKPALTLWQCIARDAASSRLLLRPHTGRSHQLRVHLASIGHPILGDGLYGNSSSAPRLLLHASRLSIDHPGSGQRLLFDSPAPF
jgi:tRNA pseudouridine32 synthase/23S rRNA pseudouridine746 synthase